MTLRSPATSVGSSQKLRATAVFVAFVFAIASCGGSRPGSQSTTSAAGAATSAGSGSPSTVAPSTTSGAPTKRILELAQSEGSLTSLLRLLRTAGLTDTLGGAGPFSLVAPTDAAFSKLDQATMSKLTGDVGLLKAVLQYHVVPKRISTKDVAAGKVTTLEGSDLALKAAGKFPTVNGNPVSRGARAKNGTILVIDVVLIPPDRTLS